MGLNTRTTLKSLRLADLATAQTRWLPVECQGARWVALSPSVNAIPLDVVFAGLGAEPVNISPLGCGLEPPALPEPQHAFVLQPGGVLEFGGAVQRIFVRPHTLQRDVAFNQPHNRWSDRANDSPAPDNMLAAFAAHYGDAFLVLALGDCEPPSHQGGAHISSIISPVAVSGLTALPVGGMVTMGGVGQATQLQLQRPAAWTNLGAWARLSRVRLHVQAQAGQQADALPRCLRLSIQQIDGVLGPLGVNGLMCGARRGAIATTGRWALNLGAPGEADALSLLTSQTGLGSLDHIGDGGGGLTAGHQVRAWLCADRGLPERGQWRGVQGALPNGTFGFPAFTLLSTATADPAHVVLATPGRRVRFHALCETLGAAGAVTVSLVSASAFQAMVNDGTPLTAPDYGPPLAVGVFAPGAATRGNITLSLDVPDPEGVVAIVQVERGGGPDNVLVRSAVLRADEP